jgi:apolipoprotein N-acyltransferase
MRPYRLVRIATEAEFVRLRGIAIRTGTRVVFAAGATIFAIGAVVFGHLAAWYWIRVSLGESGWLTAVILGAMDLLLAVVAGILASRSRPSRVEQDALQVRRQAIEALRGMFSYTRILLPLLRLAPLLNQRKRRSVRRLS